jgi:hypothetical protein
MRTRGLAVLATACLLMGLSHSSVVLGGGRVAYLPLVSRVFAPSPNPCSKKPMLLAPANGSTVNTLLPEFSWESADVPDELTWEFQAARDSAFTRLDPDHCRTVDQGWFAAFGGWFHFNLGPNFEPGMTYYWRVRLCCDDRFSDYSDPWSLMTASNGTIPARTQLLSPANGTALATLPVTLRWTAAEGATRYRLEVIGAAGSSVQGWTVDDTHVDLDWTTFSPLFDLLHGVTYSWAITSENDYAVGPASERWFFTTP